MKKLEDKIKELNEVIEALEQLLIKVISLIGWFMILYSLFK